MKLHGYTHVTEIGGGTFSKVYRAFDPHFERYVALKIIPISRKSQIVEIENEARMLAGNGLPCVPRLYDVRKSRKQVHLAMEWIIGIPLSKLLKSELIAETRNKIATDLIQALRQLHENNITHGDLKPANIIVTPDRGVVFVDFGFSYKLHKYKNPTKIQGTLYYMAPELWADNGQDDIDIDHRKADIYALGLLLEQLLYEPLPEFISSLHENDPVRRPKDCSEIERNWRSIYVCNNDYSSRKHIAEAVSMYIAELLLNGARELYSSGNVEDAYTLLTESLEKWPDNPEALTFLKHRFSGLIKREEKKNPLRFYGTTAIIVCALSIAYFYGRHSSGEQVSEKVQNIFALTEQRRLQIQVPEAGTFASPEVPGSLLSVDHRKGLTGKLIVVLPDGNGSLYINGKEHLVKTIENEFSDMFSYGELRIEWYDSTAQRRYGETTWLSPFTTKLISLKRFEPGSLYGK